MNLTWKSGMTTRSVLLFILAAVLLLFYSRVESFWLEQILPLSQNMSARFFAPDWWRNWLGGDGVLLVDQRVSRLAEQVERRASRLENQVLRLEEQGERVSRLENQWLQIPAVAKQLGSAENLQKELLSGQIDLSNRIEILEKNQIKIQQGSLLISKRDDNWKLANIFSKQRILTQRVTFPQPFADMPKIVFGVTSMQLARGDLRLAISIQDKQPDGFTLTVETKSEERIDDFPIDWTAFGN